jgi:serine/threonine-protein kinase
MARLPRACDAARDAPPDELRSMSWRTGTRRLFPYLLVAAIGFVGAYLVVYFFFFPSALVPSDIHAPNVVGTSYDAAVTKLQAAGFSAEQGSKNFHATAAAGTVLRQYPGPGALEPRGTRFRLDVSAGQRMAEVPNVVGMVLQRAEVSVQNVGLEVDSVIRVAGDAARGQVLAIDPLPGTSLQLPAKVTLTVSTGPSVVAVPDLSGRTAPEARSALRDAGLRFVEPPEVDSLSSGTPGTVVRQRPAPGASVKPGTGVRVTVAAEASPFFVPGTP